MPPKRNFDAELAALEELRNSSPEVAEPELAKALSFLCCCLIQPSLEIAKTRIVSRVNRAGADREDSKLSFTTNALKPPGLEGFFFVAAGGDQGYYGCVPLSCPDLSWFLARIVLADR